MSSIIHSLSLSSVLYIQCSMDVESDTYQTKIVASVASTSEQILESNGRYLYLRDEAELARFGKKQQLKV